MNSLSPIPDQAIRQPSPLPYADGDWPRHEEDVPWISLADILRCARVHRRLILGCAAVTVGLALAILALLPPVYQSSALVMVQEQQSHVVDDPSVLSGIPSDPSFIASQVEILKSRALAAKVVDHLGLTHDPEFTGTSASSAYSPMYWIRKLLAYLNPGNPQDMASAALAPTQRLRETVIAKLQSHVDIDAIGHSTLIGISVRSHSAASAAKIANALASTYVQTQIDAKFDATRGASKWLTSRVQQLALQSRAADAAVQQYKADHSLMDTTSGTSITDQQLADLTTQLILAETTASDAQAKLARVRDLVRSGHGADVTQVVVSPLIGQLREQEATLVQTKAELSSRYGPRYPKMLDINAQIKELRQKINDEINRVIGTVSNDVAVATAHVAALKQNMAALRARANVQNQARVKLGALQANATSIQTLYQTYLDRLKQTQQQASLSTPDVRVVSSASVPLIPAFPKKTLILAAAIPGGLLIGLLFAMIAERLNMGFRTSDELEAILGVDVVAIVPELRRRTRRTNGQLATEVVARPLSQFSEAVRAILFSLSLPGRGRTLGKAVVVTSTVPEEGKTTLAASLARQAALSGNKVIVVDGDLRRPKIAAALGLNNVKHTLPDFLHRQCLLDEALAADPHSTVVALAGLHSTNAPSLIESDEMKDLINRLRTVADLVVIDAPPLLAVNDAKILARLADHTMLVVRWEKTPRDVVRKAAKALRNVDVRFTATLTRANPKQSQYYSYGFKGALALARYYRG